MKKALLTSLILLALNAQAESVFRRGNSFSIFYRIEDEGIFTACRRIDGAPPGIDKIARGYGRIIRPFGIVAQVESIGFAIVGDFPFFRHAGNQFARRIITG